ncbi:hypothetical protein BDN70DRAFT_933760 [Pholiota conissans]|uniref:HNH nuclease domain-containing protein n=1 Tax=Pholiota conissans TaxID=109636 RepID=A0A9P5YZC6_9AGAR|nr:hypothetical protein BDN70DRAFT_933760 [Pholiota conissans]
MSTISIYASFPNKSFLPRNAALDDITNWSWLHCLTIPLETPNQYSRYPYKWLRFCIGSVVGAEGDISTTTDPSDIVDYDAALPAESTNLFYHTTPQEKQRMFPLDPHIDMGRSDTVSKPEYDMVSIEGDAFVDQVENRDRFEGPTLAMSNKRCNDAVHIIPDTKGNEYIRLLTEGRSRDPAGADIIMDIESIRNGLLMNILCHVVFGRQIAILQTPNFAMNSADVDASAAPNEKRWTYHFFKESPDDMNPTNLPPGSELHMNRDCDPSLNPPAILLDAVYAALILRHFGAEELEDRSLAFAKDVFYPEGRGHLTEFGQHRAEQRRVRDKRLLLQYEAVEKVRKQMAQIRKRLKTQAGKPDHLDNTLLGLT